MEYLELILTVIFSVVALVVVIYFILFLVFFWYALTTAELDPNHEEEI